MTDIFDTITLEKPKRDIFDEIEPTKPDMFDKVAPSIPPPHDNAILKEAIEDPEKGLNRFQQFGKDVGTVLEASKLIAFDFENLPEEFKGTGDKGIYDKIKNIMTRALSPLAYIMPGVSHKQLIEELDEEAAEFSGFGPALVPAAGQIGEMTVELAAFQQSFSAVHRGVGALAKLPVAEKIATVVSEVGGIAKFATKFPRLAQTLKLAGRAFFEGNVVGQGFELLRSVDEDKGVLDTLKAMNKAGATTGTITAVFNLTQSADRALYVNKLRKVMVRKLGDQLKVKISELPEGVSPRTLESFKRGGLKQIDNIVSATEADLLQMTAGKAFAGQKADSPHKAAERFMQQGFTLKGAKGAAAGRVEALKKGLGKPEPFIKMPTTRAGEARETISEVGKAIKSPIKAAQQARARDIKVKPPSAVQPIAPAQPPVAKPPVEDKVVPTKPPTAKIEPQAVEADPTKTLILERRDIKKIPKKLLKPAQIERLNVIEDELVRENADLLPEIDISPKNRRVETKKVRDQITSHGIYEVELEGLQDVPDMSGNFPASKSEMEDIRARFEGRPDILKKFTEAEHGGTRIDEVSGDMGIGGFDDFLDAVEIYVDLGKAAKGAINESALARALNSGDPLIELFALKHDMLKNEFTAAEINKEINEFANREGIEAEQIKPELIQTEDITDVDTKQAILRELDKTVGKVKKKQISEPEKVAIAKARGIAFKTKSPVYIIEKPSGFSVVKTLPATGEFIKITPPVTGELEGELERLTGKPKKPKLTPEQVKEVNLLKQKINIERNKKGIGEGAFSDLKMKHGGSRRLAGAKPRTIEQLQAVLKAVQRARPSIVGHKKVITRKTEKEIKELRQNLTDLEFMNDAEFKKILDIETRGKEPKYIDAKNFITQKEGREILNRMHDTAQRLRVTEPIRIAVEKNPEIKSEIAKIEKLPKKTKDPARLKSMRFFIQRMGEQAGQPIYDVFLDLTLEEQARSRVRHKSTKLSEAMPGFAKIANDPEALQRVEDWIVSKSTLKDKPKSPKDITAEEVRLAKLIQASFEAYETLARAGKMFEFFDNRAEMPQYLKFKQSIDKAFDIYNTQGYDALIKYLDRQDWGIVSAGYSPMESVVKKVSTHRMPQIAVGKGRIRQRGITYRKQERDILQRWYSYMRQMDQLVHIQPRIKSLVRLVNDSQASFVNPSKVNSVVSTYLDNLKHTNYEDGLIEEWSRRLYSQAITVRVLADPLKPLRNLVQNAAFSEDRRDFLDPRNKKLTAEDLEYLETHVQQASVMMTDWAFVGENPLFFKNLTRWVQRKTLYPTSDRINRLISFHAKINRVRRAFAKDQTLEKKMKNARFSDMQNTEQRKALEILAKDGVDDMARYIAKVHTDNTHFLYAREQRSPAEQTKLGRIALNLALFRRAALEKALFQLGKIFQKGTGFSAKRRAASVLVTLLGMSALLGIIWKKLTGQRYSPYSYFNFLELNFGGLEVAVIQKAEDAYNSMLAILSLEPKKIGKALDTFGTDITKVADYMIPFYDLGLRAIEAIIGSENIDRVPARKLREIIDKEYKSRGLKQIDRSLVEKIQFTFAKGGASREVKEQKTDLTKARVRK